MQVVEHTPSGSIRVADAVDQHNSNPLSVDYDLVGKIPTSSGLKKLYSESIVALPFEVHAISALLPSGCIEARHAILFGRATPNWNHVS